jgi:hypothetical protein
MSPFSPLHERARWRVIYDLLRATPVDQVLSYEAMGEALDLDGDKDRRVLQQATQRAARELERVDNHAVDAVINTGYRVLQAPEHLQLARRHQRKSSKALVRGQSAVVHVDWSALDPIARQAFELVGAALTAQVDFCRRLDVRQRELANAMQLIQQEHRSTKEHTATELDKVQERLARLEGLLGDK